MIKIFEILALELVWFISLYTEAQKFCKKKYKKLLHQQKKKTHRSYLSLFVVRSNEEKSNQAKPNQKQTKTTNNSNKKLNKQT